MNKIASFNVDDHIQEFIEAQVSQGRYVDASEVVRAALRLLEEQGSKPTAFNQGSIDVVESDAAQPDTSKSETGPRRSLYGLMRGTVAIPEGFDLTAPAFDGDIHAEDGRLHE